MSRLLYLLKLFALGKEARCNVYMQLCLSEEFVTDLQKPHLPSKTPVNATELVITRMFY